MAILLEKQKSDYGPTPTPLFPKWVNKFGHHLMDAIHFVASGFAISAFWHFVLVPTGLKDLSVGQIFWLVLAGRFLTGSVRRLARMVQVADKETIESRTALWQSAEVMRMLCYGVFMALYLWFTHRL